MKIKRKFIVFIVVVLIICILFLLWKFLKNRSNDLNFVEISLDNATGVINNRTGITNEKNFNGLLFTDINLSEYNDINLSENNVCVFEAYVTNLTENTISEMDKKIRFLDKKGNEIKTIDIFIDAIKPGEKTIVHIQTYEDIIEAYSFELLD